MAESAQPAPQYTVMGLDTRAPSYKWLVAAIVLLAGSTQTFAGNSVNLAIPRLMAAFGTDLATAQWVITSFLITRTLVTPILGWLGSVMGNRNLFVAMLVTFVIASLGCSLAPNLPILILCRLIQGCATGPMEGLSAVILVQTFPARQRGTALGLRSIGGSAGQIVSFTAGGYLMERLSWRVLFLLGIPTGVLAAVLGWLMLPQHREEYRGEPVDYPGLVSLGGFLVPLLLLISLGRRADAETSMLVLLGLGALLGGGCFVLRELLAAFPAVNLRLFTRPAFGLICATTFFNSLGLFGAQFMVPIFLQQVIGLTPLQAGLAIVPALIVSAMTGPHRTSHRHVTAVASGDRWTGGDHQCLLCIFLGDGADHGRRTGHLHHALPHLHAVHLHADYCPQYPHPRHASSAHGTGSAGGGSQHRRLAGRDRDQCVFRAAPGAASAFGVRHVRRRHVGPPRNPGPA